MAENKNPAATGRRKEAVARATLTPGKGMITINKKRINDYLARETLIRHALQPLVVVEMSDKLDIVCSTRGGGISGQAGAVRLAIARALVKLNPELHSILRKGGFLTVDARVVERKKYGQPKARKRFQFSKR